MRSFLKNLPMRRKLLVIIVTVCSAALLLTCLAIFWFQAAAFRQSYVVELESLATVVARNAAAPLMFRDPKSAEEIVATLKVKAHITGACIFDDHNQVVACFYDGEPDASPVPGVPEGTTGFRDGNAVLRLPIMEGGTRLGTLHLLARFDSEYHRLLWKDAVVMLVVLTLALVVIVMLSSLLQGAITGPILALVSVARNVSEKEDYATRAPETGRDEVGLLTRTFNQMLDQIESRDRRLREANTSLEREMAGRAQVEAALRESRERYEMAVMGSSDGLWDWKLDTNEIYFSPRWKQMIGCGDEELANHVEEFETRLHPEDREAVRQVREEYLEGLRLTYAVEFRLRHRAGHYVWILARGAATRDENGKALRLAGSHTDISARKEAEAELAYERDLLKTLLENLPDSIYFKDLQSRVVRGSKYFAQRFHATDLDFILGKTDADFFTPEHAQPALQDEQKIIRTGNPIIGKLEKATFPDGRISWVLTTKMPWRDRDGRIVGTFGISKDITPIKEAETKLAAVHQQLVEASRAAGMAEVATGVLHNVGNVLNSVNVSASLLRDTVKKSQIQNLVKATNLLRDHAGDTTAFLTTDPKGQRLPSYFIKLGDHLATEQRGWQEELDGLTKNIEHIKEIVAMQQSYAKLSGLMEILNARELTEDALRMNEGALERHGVKMVRDFQDVPLVEVDKHKVLQILVNLIRNAKYAMEAPGAPGKNLTVSIRVAGSGWVGIQVRDQGVGIPPENLTRIFQHGFTTKKEGHGFGLHSSANAAKEMGGTLSAQSDGPGTGATFILELPVAKTKELTTHEN